MDYQFIENFVRQTFEAANYLGRASRLTIQPYSFSLPEFALAVNGAGTQTLEISSNADFVALAIRCPVYAGGVFVDNPNLKVKIVDTGSNEQLSSNFVDINALKDSPSDSPGLVYPRVFSGRSAVSVEFQNGAAALDIVRFTFVGVLVRALD